MKAETITATMVFKEIFYAIVLAVFFKLGTTVYSCFSSFVSFLSNEKARHGWMVDGICMLALMITSVVFSSIVADTAFYFLLPQSYVVLLGIAGFVLLSLCMVAYICQRMISAKIGVVSRLKGIIGFVFEFILQLFAVILIYFTVLIYMELAYTENSLATYLVMIFSLIACIGLCTAIFVYYLQGIRLTKQTI